MKYSKRFVIRAALVLTAGGVIGAFGACKEGPVQPPPPVPPPPPPPLAAPTALTATAVSQTRIDLAWTDNASNETGFKVERCSGAGCTNYAQVGTNLAANTVAFVDETGLTASTQYSYRVAAFDATASSAFASVNATTLGTTPPPAGLVMVGAGEITSCASQASMQTANLIDSVIAKHPDAIVFTTGNNVADSTGATYANCFEPRWGKFLSRMRPAIGQRDYDKGPDAAFSYFGDKIPNPGKGWYSFDVGENWHVIVLNTATWQWGSSMMTDPTSEQNVWLANDLAANTKPCTIAIMNLRRYYSYGSFENLNVKNIWRSLHSVGVDMVINGYDKYYERWNPQDHDMHADPTNGVVQFTVGTGGRTLDNYPNSWKPVDQVPNLAVRDASTHGVLKLTLHATSYEYEFIPTIAGAFTDKSAAPVSCH
jgi:acid phosphatase type 7